MKKWALPILLMAIIVVAGCIGQPEVAEEIAEIEEIKTPDKTETISAVPIEVEIPTFYANPASYVGKKIKVTGEFFEGNEILGEKYPDILMLERNKIGMFFLPKDDRTFVDDETYTIIGTVVTDTYTYGEGKYRETIYVIIEE